MNELYHYGVKGMRWGVRRKLGTTHTIQPSSGGGGEFDRERYGHDTDNSLPDISGGGGGGGRTDTDKFNQFVEDSRKGRSFLENLQSDLKIKMSQIKHTARAVMDKAKKIIGHITGKTKKVLVASDKGYGTNYRYAWEDDIPPGYRRL